MATEFRRYTGWLPLAGEFPPTLNKDQDAPLLKVNETPDAYGVAYNEEGILKAGSVPTGTARVAPLGTGSYTSYNWYFKRLWKATTTVLDYGAPFYRDMFYRQDLGKVITDANIVTFFPMLGNSMFVGTATGSHVIPNANNDAGGFQLSPFEQEMQVTNATYTTRLDDIPFTCNPSGVYSWDGSKVKEWTLPIRENITNFASIALTSEYEKKLIIGTSKFVIDTVHNRLFDYGTSGFRFQTRTIAQPGRGQWGPFIIKGIAIVYETSSTKGKIGWESKMDDNSWHSERNIIIPATSQPTREEYAINNAQTECRWFTMRLTSMTSSVKIREIQVVVEGLMQEAFVED